MGTRSITRIQVDGETLVAVYRQFDGYISGHGKDLADFMNTRKIVNGIMFGAEDKVFNGPGCLAANIIWMMKDKDQGSAGGIYIHSTDTEDEEYAYNINVVSKEQSDPWGPDYEDYPIITVIRCGEKIFEGNSLKFIEFVRAGENFEE